MNNCDNLFLTKKSCGSPAHKTKKKHPIIVTIRTVLTIIERKIVGKTQIKKQLSSIGTVLWAQGFISNQQFSKLCKAKTIHFHLVQDLLAFDILFKENSLTEKPTLILTSHSPQISAMEYAENLKEKHYTKKQINYFVREYEKAVDIPAFTNADEVIFPSESALDPYFSTSSAFKKIHERLSLNYILSGCPKLNCHITKKILYQKYNIPENSYVVCYIGRHNKVKGYDILKQAGELILAKHNDVVFLLAGTEKPIQGINHTRWKELGWISAPEELLSLANIFILPNRETYFDLIALEVLSTGTPIIATNTGGNKTLNQMNSVVSLCETDADSIAEKIEEHRLLTVSEHIEIEQQCMQFYEDHFTLSAFAKRYIHLITELQNKSQNTASFPL